MAGVMFGETAPFPASVFKLGLGRVGGGLATSLLGVLQVGDGSLRVMFPLNPSGCKDRGLLRGVLPLTFSELYMSRTPITSS